MRAFRISSMVVLGLALSLSGAVPSGAAPARRVGRAGSPDLFGGYSYTHAGEAALHGWGLAASYPLRGSLRLVADVCGHYGSFGGADLSQLGVLFGARWSFRGRGVRPFVEGLAGAVRTSVEVTGGAASDADTDWGLAFGGGADYPLGDRWSARALVQLRLLRGEGASDTDPRVALGAVYRFGR